jgi:hypothetical protein
VGQIWQVPYQERAGLAEVWAKKYHIPPASNDTFIFYLLLVVIPGVIDYARSVFFNLASTYYSCMQ